MDESVLDATAQWVGATVAEVQGQRFEAVFHGGEPLVAGEGYYRAVLPRLRDAYGARSLRLSMQSNLWLLTDELCEFLAEQSVSLGTSLDGPEAITDGQRGEGYYGRTMAGLERARRHGLSVACICTFTRQSAPMAEGIAEFFAREGLDFSIHPAVPRLGEAADDWSISPAAHGELLVRLLDWYVENLSRVRIGSLDALCRSVSTSRGSVCTFCDCLGDYLAVGPDGGIYPCQRFVGREAFRVGRVQEQPSPDTLAHSPAWRLLREREERMREECGNCVHFPYCRGGCPYDALAEGRGSFAGLRDPYCVAYRRVFGHLTERALGEVLSEDNLNAVVTRPGDGTLLRRGRLVGLMRGAPHPRDSARRARELLASVALASGGSLTTLAERLVRAGAASSPRRAEDALADLARRLAPQRRLNNLYLHVTFGCNLRCSHCYAAASPERIIDEALPVAEVASLCRQAAAEGFRQAVITGGEPLTHPDWRGLIEALASLRAEVKPLLTMFRTNLTLPLGAEWLLRLGRCVDKIAISVDGDRARHDARRGAGSYDAMAAALRELVSGGCEAELLLTSVLPLEEVLGVEGEAVRALARDLGIRRVHFRPLLPLGRAGEAPLEVVREAYWASLSPGDAVAYGVSPTSSCGMGQNLYVEPNGAAHPCYACNDEGWLLGNVRHDEALRRLLHSSAFQALAGHTVDTNRQCRECPLRYLCGGACRAWNGRVEHDLDAPPADCSRLRARAHSLLLAALAQAGVSPSAWASAGLPWSRP